MPEEGEELYWERPKNARRNHIYDGIRSLCGNWLFTGDRVPVENDDTYREGEDCKVCCLEAGVLDDE